MTIYILILIAVALGSTLATRFIRKYENSIYYDFDKAASEFESRHVKIQGEIWVNSQKKGAECAVVSALKILNCMPEEFDPEDFYSTKPLIVTLVDGAIELFFLLEGESKSQAYNIYVNFLLDGTFVSKDTNGNIISYSLTAINVFKEAAEINSDTKKNLIKCLYKRKEVFEKVFPDMTAKPLG